MRRLLPLLIIPLIAGCGQQPNRERESAPPQTEYAPSDQAAESAAPNARMASPEAGPAIGVTAAPGVAFNYHYAFRLPAERVAEVQEQHAAFCERLGVARCRITGMRYRVINERDIEAMLAFKLEPSIARQFGREGVQAVIRAEGMLVDSEITGTDVGTTIRNAGRSIAQMQEELRRLEAQLARRDLPGDEKARLEYEAQQLRQSIQAQQASREDQQEALANTPMVFEYGSGDVSPGFGHRPSFRHAASQALDNFLSGLLVLFVILVTLLPWIVLGLIGWWIVRRIIRWVRRTRGTLSSPATAPGGVEVTQPPAG